MAVKSISALQICRHRVKKQCGKEGDMNENNLKIKKIQKSSKAAFTVTNIVKIFLIVAAVILLITGFIMIGRQEFFNASFDAALRYGEFTVEEFDWAFEGQMLQHMMEDGQIALALGLYLTEMGVVLVCFTVVLHFVGKVFKTFQESYSPFQPKVIRNLRITFILLTMYTLSTSLGIGLIAGLASWCVLNIFEYGCELQKQSDETL